MGALERVSIALSNAMVFQGMGVSKKLLLLMVRGLYMLSDCP